MQLLVNTLNCCDALMLRCWSDSGVQQADHLQESPTPQRNR